MELLTFVNNFDFLVVRGKLSERVGNPLSDHLGFLHHFGVSFGRELAQLKKFQRLVVSTDPSFEQRVWSLTSFYSVSFLKSRTIIVTKIDAFKNTITIKICVSCSSRCLGTTVLSAANGLLAFV